MVCMQKCFCSIYIEIKHFFDLKTFSGLYMRGVKRFASKKPTKAKLIGIRRSFIDNCNDLFVQLYVSNEFCFDLI